MSFTNRGNMLFNNTENITDAQWFRLAYLMDSVGGNDMYACNTIEEYKQCIINVLNERYDELSNSAYEFEREWADDIKHSIQELGI